MVRINLPYTLTFPIIKQGSWQEYKDFHWTDDHKNHSVWIINHTNSLSSNLNDTKSDFWTCTLHLLCLVNKIQFMTYSLQESSQHDLGRLLLCLSRCKNSSFSLFTQNGYLLKYICTWLSLNPNQNMQVDNLSNRSNNCSNKCYGTDGRLFGICE